MVDWTQRPIGEIPFVANSPQKLAIPRDKSIRRIIMRFVINLTTGATAPTYLQDDITRIIKKIEILKSADDIVTSVSGRLWYFIEKFEKKTDPYYVAPTSATSTTADAIVTLMADFAIDRTNESDVRALLHTRPHGHQLSGLELKITWGSASDIASANAPTINAASKCIVEIREASGSATILNKDNLEETVNVNALPSRDIREIEDVIPLLNNKTSFDASSVPYNISPAPALHMTHGLLVSDAGVRSDSLVTTLKIQNEVGGTNRMIENSWNALKESTKTEYAQESIPVGFLYLDHIDMFNGGIAHLGTEGDLKYRLLTSNGVTEGTDVVNLFVRYEKR